MLKKIFKIFPLILASSGLLAANDPCLPLQGCTGVSNPNTNTLTLQAPIILSASVSSALDINSTTLGSRPYPEMTQIQRDSIVSPENGLIIYNNTTKTLDYYDGSNWQKILNTQNLQAGANITVTDNGNGTVTISATGGGTTPTPSYSAYSVHNNLTGRNAISGFVPVPVGSGFTSDEEACFTNSIQSISGVNTPVAVYTCSQAQFFEVDQSMSMQSIANTFRQYIYAIAIKRAGGSIETTDYQLPATQDNDLADDHPTSIHGIVFLSQGDGVFTQVSGGSDQTAPTTYITSKIYNIPGSIPTTDSLPQGTNNQYLSQNGGATLSSATGSITDQHLAKFSGTSGLVADAGVGLSDLTFQYLYNNDPNYPTVSFYVPISGEFDVVYNSGAGDSTLLSANPTYGILGTVGFTLLPSSNTEEVTFIKHTTDAASTMSQFISTTRGAVQYPAMTATNETSIPTTTAPQGLGLYNTTTNTLDFWSGSAWVNLINSVSNQTIGGTKTFSSQIVGDISGTAVNATNVNTTINSSNASFYIPFVASSSAGNQALNINSNFSYNPSTTILTVPHLTIPSLSANQLVGLNGSNALTSIGAGTSTTVLHGNAAGLPTYSSVALGTDVSGTLGFTNGGFGFNTATTGDIFYASGTNTPGKLSDVATGSVLASQGAGATPAWLSSPTLTGLTLSSANNLNFGNSTGVNVLTINSASGASNRADLVLNRFDSTNGNNRLFYNTGGSSIWSMGMRAGSQNYTIFDETNVLAQLTMTQGSGTSGTSTFAGSITSNNNLTVNTGNVVIGTAGKTLSIKTGTNACSGTTTLSGATTTINTSCATTGDLILMSVSAVGGTQGLLSYTISPGLSFTTTSTQGSADTSTIKWLIVHQA